MHTSSAINPFWGAYKNRTHILVSVALCFTIKLILLYMFVFLHKHINKKKKNRTGHFPSCSPDEFLAQVLDRLADPKCGWQIGSSGFHCFTYCIYDIRISVAKTRDSSTSRCVKHLAPVTCKKSISLSPDDFGIHLSKITAKCNLNN